MDQEAQCGNCGGELDSGSRGGVCRRCLAEAAATVQSSSPDSRTVAAAPGPGALVRYFGDYELHSEIARGGMGVVYRARQVSLNRTVALKMVLAAEFASPEQVKRFHLEAEAAANLDHPNIVPIYEIGEQDGRHYYSMKLVEGSSLARHAAGFSRDLRRAAEIVAKVARAVHYAHQRGLLHRDIKPANILLDEQGEAMVTDFGLAKKIESESDLTHPGSVLGTPNYMAPEQAAGGSRDVTTRSDVFSLGAVLYHLIAGRPPFEAPTALETLRKVMDEEPAPPASINPRIDRDLATICSKSVEKDPSRRFASAEEFADELDRWLEHEPILSRPVSSPEKVVKWVRRKPVVAALSGAALASLLLGMIGVLWQWGRAEEQRKLAEQRADSERKARIEEQSARAAEAAANEQALNTLARLELQKANEIAAATDASKARALPHLARSLRENPRNTNAAFRLVSMLMHQNFAWPLFESRLEGSSILAQTMETNRVVLLVRTPSGAAALLDAATEEPLLHVPGLAGSPGFGQFSGDGRFFLVQDASNFTAHVFRHPARTAPPVAIPLSGPLRDALFDADHDRLLTLEHEPRPPQVSRLRVWKLSSGAALSGPFEQAQVFSIRSLAFDGQSALLNGSPGSVTIDLKTGSKTSMPLGGAFMDSPGFPELRVISPYVATETTSIFGTIGEIRIHFPVAPPNTMRTLSEVLLRSTELLPGGGLRAYDLRARRAIARIHSLPQGQAEFAQLTRDGRRLVRMLGRTVEWRDSVDGTALFAWTAPEAGEEIAQRKLSPDGEWFWVARSDRGMSLVQARTNGAVVNLPPRIATNEWFAGVSFSPDSRHLALSTTEGNVHLLETAGARWLWERKVGSNASVSVSFLGDNAHIVAASATNLQVLSAHDGSSVAALAIADSQQARWAPNAAGTALALRGSEMELTVYSLPGLQRKASIREEARIENFEFSPSGDLLAVSSSAGKLRLFDWKASRQAAELSAGPSFAAPEAVFAPDGERVALISSSGTIIFDIRSGAALSDEILKALSGVPSVVRWIEDDFLVRLESSGAVTICELPRVSGPVPGWLPRLAEAVAGESIDPSGAPRPVPFGALELLRAELGRLEGGEFYPAFARWFVEKIENRGCSPRIVLPAREELLQPSEGYSGHFGEALSVLPSNLELLERDAADSLEELLLPRAFTSFRTPETEAQQKNMRAQSAWAAMARFEMHHPAHPSAAFLRAACWLAWNDSERASAALSNAAETAQTSEFFWIIRSRLLEKSNAEQAIQAWQKALDLVPSSREQRARRVRENYKSQLIALGRRGEAGRVHCRELGLPERAPGTPPNLVDLSLSYNGALSVARGPTPGHTLAEAPLGVNDFAGTKFDLRGYIEVSPFRPSASAAQAGISARAIHFLQTALQGHPNYDGKTVATYVLEFADGSKEAVPVVYGKHVRDWFILDHEPDPPAEAALAWTGSNPESRRLNTQIRFFKMTVPNPKPDRRIERISFVPGHAGPILLTLGITLEPN